ncbi:2Fe-2S iron-sulfur cluster-binding protein [Deinococcus lacus]|uniref:2Fe-2S iron-sulfur cluster-binding protein n=1 Tax=Deinococcus lacus TaxID=392561 RepID=A0ABW1YEB0_9DEIO
MTTQDGSQFLIEVQGFAPVPAQSGERLVLALARAGTGILHRCGGVAKCTTCAVTFSAGEPAEMRPAERAKLEEKGLLGEARLSCQILCAPGMALSILKTEASTGLEAGKQPAPELEPAL